MSYINATVVIPESEQSSAQEAYPGSFTSGFTDSNKNVFYVCSGLWKQEEIDKISSGAFSWPSKVYYEEVGYVLSELGLSPAEA